MKAEPELSRFESFSSNSDAQLGRRTPAQTGLSGTFAVSTTELYAHDTLSYIPSTSQPTSVRCMTNMCQIQYDNVQGTEVTTYPLLALRVNTEIPCLVFLEAHRLVNIT